MNLLIFTSLLGYSRHIVIDDEPFIRSTRKKKKKKKIQPHIILFIKYLTLYNNLI